MLVIGDLLSKQSVDINPIFQSNRNLSEQVVHLKIEVSAPKRSLNSNLVDDRRSNKNNINENKTYHCFI